MMWFSGLKSLLRSGAAPVADIDAETYAKSVAETVARVQEEEAAAQSQCETLTDKSAFIKAAGGQLLIQGEENDVSLSMTRMKTSFTPELITDFAPEEDSLLFVWDDSTGQDEPPMVTVTADPQALGQLQVCLEDKVIAKVSGPGALEEVDISMIPMSSAQALDLIAK